MAIKNKPKILCASLLATFGCLSANASTPRYQVQLGKLSDESEGPLKALYADWNYPIGIFFYRIYESQNTDLDPIFVSRNYSFSIVNKTEPWTFETNIGSEYFLNKPFYLVATFEVRENTPFLGASTYYRATFWSSESIDGQKTIKNPTPNTVYNINRPYFSSSNKAIINAHDAYYVGEWKKDITNGVYHAINLPSCQIGYADALGDDVDMGGSAALYIYTDPSSWNIGSITFINGQRVRAIPLQINYIGKKTINGRSYRMYSPSLTRTYVVSRYNLKMYTSSEGLASKTYFSSTDLFIPIRNKKESNTWQFGINWFNLSEFGDRFEMSFSINLGSNLFGNCDDSLYCIGLGHL